MFYLTSFDADVSHVTGGRSRKLTKEHYSKGQCRVVAKGRVF